jgi:hypothetical protein
VLEPYRGRIIYIKQENRGPSGARNAAIRRARGVYVALLDSDDVWLPDYLTEQMKILRDDPSADLVYADAQLFGDSVLAGQTLCRLRPRKAVTFESLARWECCVITSCTVARRQSLIDAGLFDENFVRSEDFDLWLRLAHRGGRLIYQRRVLARHRLHEASLAADSTRMFESQIEVFRKMADTLPLSLQEQKLIETQIASCEAHIALEKASGGLRVETMNRRLNSSRAPMISFAAAGCTWRFLECASPAFVASRLPYAASRIDAKNRRRTRYPNLCRTLGSFPRRTNTSA